MVSPVATPNAVVPLCVDLDGTLIRSDMLWESLARLARRNPLYLFAALAWFTRGRAHLKAEIARRTAFDVSSIPLCPAFLQFLKSQKAAGRELLLVTASDFKMAEPVAKHVGLFDGVLASDGQTNLRGNAKAACLEAKFGRGGFDYAGNSSMDLPVWAAARHAIVVNASAGVEARARARSNVFGVFDPLPSVWAGLVKALRPHQWLKNLVVFVPLIAAHKVSEPLLGLKALLAFLAFCCYASAVYLINDLADLDADRQHTTKRFRPFAAGTVPLQYGFAGAPLLLLAGGLLSLLLPWGFAATLAVYFVLATSYSWTLKQAVLVDVFCLAALYTLRLVGGHEATGVAYSSWLLVFSMFIFLSLALLKRFVELKTARVGNAGQITGRGYAANDLELVAALGASSGFIAVLVIALYVNSKEVLELYSKPVLLLLICPLLLYWISRVWLLAHRGRMHEDPVVFALKDPASYGLGAAVLAVLWAASTL